MSKRITLNKLLQLLPRAEQSVGENVPTEDTAALGTAGANEAALRENTKETAKENSEEHSPEGTAAAESAYERLGKAFLSKLGLPEAMLEDEAERESLVSEIISVWEKVEARMKSEADAQESGAETDIVENANADALPRPLEGGLSQAPAADYATMSAEQFRALQKQLKRAAMDGRKIRL